MSARGFSPIRTSQNAKPAAAASTSTLATSSTPRSWRSVAVVSVSGTATTSVPAPCRVVASARHAERPSRTVKATVRSSPSSPEVGGGSSAASGGGASSSNPNVVAAITVPLSSRNSA